VSPYRFCETALRPVYLSLLGWVNRWIPDLEAADIAATVMADWLFMASGGHGTQWGPYKELFQHAESRMRWWGQGHGYDVPFGIWRTVPLPEPELLCTLARVYSLVYMATELGQVSVPERKILANLFRLGRFDSTLSWRLPTADPHFGQMTAILDRALDALIHHQCVPFDSCQEFNDLWGSEDRRGEWWLKDFRIHAREYVHGN
jgi:hypothetical protein